MASRERLRRIILYRRAGLRYRRHDRLLDPARRADCGRSGRQPRRPTLPVLFHGRRSRPGWPPEVCTQSDAFLVRRRSAIHSWLRFRRQCDAFMHRETPRFVLPDLRKSPLGRDFQPPADPQAVWLSAGRGACLVPPTHRRYNVVLNVCCRPPRGSSRVRHHPCAPAGGILPL